METINCHFLSDNQQDWIVIEKFVITQIDYKQSTCFIVLQLAMEISLQSFCAMAKQKKKNNPQDEVKLQIFIPIVNLRFIF